MHYQVALSPSEWCGKGLKVSNVVEICSVFTSEGFNQTDP